MHNGGNLALPTLFGERRFEIECVSRPTTILFPLSLTLDTWTLDTWNIGHLVSLVLGISNNVESGYISTWTLGHILHLVLGLSDYLDIAIT